MKIHVRKLIKNIYKQRFKLNKELFWIMGGQALTVFGGLVGIRFLTSYVKPSTYGEVSLAMTATTLIKSASLLPIGHGLVRYYAPAKENNSMGSYWGAGAFLLILTSLIVLVFGCITIFILKINNFNYLYSLSIVIFLFSLISGLNSIIDSIQNAARNRRNAALHQGLGLWARYIFALLFVFLLKSESELILLGYSLGAFISFISRVYFLKFQLFTDFVVKKWIDIEIKEWTKKIFKYSWPFITWSVITWAQQSSDRWAIHIFGTTTEVGIYSVLFQLGYYPFLLGSGLISRFIFPILSERAGDGFDKGRVNRAVIINIKITVVLIIFTVFCSIFSVFFHGQIFRLLVSEEYRFISPLLPWMVLAGGLFASGQNATLVMMTKFNTNLLIAPKLFTSIIGLFLSFGGAYLYGIRGVVFANLLFSLIFVIWILILSIRN